MINTVAPGSTAPVWSVTVPRIRPKLACANSARENSTTPSIVTSTGINVLAPAVFNVTDFIRVPLYEHARITTPKEKASRQEQSNHCHRRLEIHQHGFTLY